MRYVVRNEDGQENIIALILKLDLQFPWEIEVKRYRKKRSNAQLAYFYAGIVKPICDETGNDQQTIHDFLCGNRWGWKENTVFGQVRKVPVRTLTSPEPLPVEDMVTFCEWCVAEMAQHGILLEPPREVEA